MSAGATVPAIADYGVIGDGHTAALISRAGSVDWLCLPRLDSGSCFGRLLDAERGGHFALGPRAAGETSRAYLDGTAILETTHTTADGVVRVTDALLSAHDERRLLRVVDGVRGTVELEAHIAPRVDFGQVRPWIRRLGERTWAAIGGDDGLVIGGDAELHRTGDHELAGPVTVSAGERARLVMAFRRPEEIDAGRRELPTGPELDEQLDGACAAWREWAGRGEHAAAHEPGVMRSALTLKLLANPDTGALAAAATTSLPEVLGGARNWDYRYSWIRDSTWAVRALAEVGFEREADAFRRFVQRSSAGHADELQVLFGLGGERRLPEQELDLAGYGGSTPVRVGNGAAGQLQLDAFGELVGLTWRWQARGHEPDDDAWRFLVSLADRAARRWRERDAGLWEWRGDPRHFVHSKALCWSALHRAIALAHACGRPAPTRRWAAVRDEIGEAIEAHGVDRARGCYVQAFGSPELDAALLLLPVTGYVAWDDEGMVATTDAVWEELDAGRGLLYRYRRDDGLGGREGAFLACTFWLAECLARQGRAAEAREVLDSGAATANDLGLFSEELDPATGEMLGNVPQALTHLSHIAAAVALAEAG